MKIETISDIRHLAIQQVQNGYLTIESMIKILKAEGFRNSLIMLAKELKNNNGKTNIL